MTLYLGCPIWAHKGWVGNFFPKGTKSADFLREYARRLTAVEGNTTFYAVPSPATIKRWKDETPDDFRFCPKIPRTVSHAGPLTTRLDDARRFVETMRGLGARLGPLFLQLPPRYSPTLTHDLREFLAAWPRDLRVAVEVRHQDWFRPPHHDSLNALLREHDAARVLIDTRPIRDMPEAEIGEGSVYVRMKQAQERKPNVPLLPVRTASFAMFRYIGHPNVEANGPWLEEWAERIAGWLASPPDPLAETERGSTSPSPAPGEGRGGGSTDVFAFCHCPDETMSPQICRELHRRVAGWVKIVPLPWSAETSATALEQERLL